MKKLLVIDACMREESRTRKILVPVVEVLSGKYAIETIRLEDMEMPSVGRSMLAERSGGTVPQWAIDDARQLAEADRIVIAAPFWDMSFPARLKVFIENTSLYGITFTDTGTTCAGLCKCRKVLYLTTRGMDIRTGSPLEQATPYLKAISALWGLGEILCVAAENLDYSTPEEVEMKLDRAIKEALELCRDF